MKYVTLASRPEKSILKNQLLETGKKTTHIMKWQNIWVSLAVLWKPVNVLNEHVAFGEELGKLWT